MESLTRPPHRRNQNSANVNVKKPYDDVLLNGGGVKAKPFGAHEYAEIFSGSSSSIPVLDIPGFDERVGSGGFRSSKLDYSNIFGDLKDCDVAVPYEELLSMDKKTKRFTEKPRIPSDPELPVQESSPIQSSGMIKKSSEESGRIADGIMQFNLSFNKISQSNEDSSNLNIHVAQLHAVPGFTYFIDGAHRIQKTENERPVCTLKRDISRTWSFSADVEAVKGKSGPSWDNFQNPDKYHNMTESILRPIISNVSPPSCFQSNICESNNSKGSKTSHFPSKDGTSVTTDGESSLPSFGEELDENSVAAISAAALKKAVEQAQKSIRLAKMIMERKREGDIPDGSKPRIKSCLKIKNSKENEIGFESISSKEKNPSIREKLNPVSPPFKELNGKMDQLPIQLVQISDSRKIELEKVRVNVESAEENGEAYHLAGKEFSASHCPSVRLSDIEKAESELLVESVKSGGANTVLTEIPGLVTKVDVRYETLEDVRMDGNNDMMMFSMNKITPNTGDAKTVNTESELSEETNYYKKEPESISEAESTHSSSRRILKRENVVGGLEQKELTSDHTQGPEIVTKLDGKDPILFQNIVETIDVDENVSIDRINQEAADIDKNQFVSHDQVKCESKYEEFEKVGGCITNARISQENEVTGENHNLTHDQVKIQGKTEECEKVTDVEHLIHPDLMFDSFMNDQPNVDETEKIDKSEKEKKYLNVPECRGKDCGHVEHRTEEENGMGPEESSRSNELQEFIDNVVSEGEPEVFIDMKEIELNVHKVHKSYNNEKISTYRNDEDGIRVPGVFNRYDIEPPETKKMEVHNLTEMRREASPRPEETNTSRGDGNEEIEKKHVSQDAACGVDVETVDDVTSSILNVSHGNNANIVFNASEEFSETFLGDKIEKNSCVPGVLETYSGIDSGRQAEPSLGPDVNDILKMNSLHRSASEDNFVGSNLYYPFEGLSPDYDTENVDSTNSNSEEMLPKDEDGDFDFEPTSVHRNSSRETADKFRTIEDELIFEQTSESGRSELSSSLENIDEVSVQESEICDDDSKNEISDKEEVEDIDMTGDKTNQVQTKGVYSAKQSEGVCSPVHVESKEMEEFAESERNVEIHGSLENKEKINETSAMDDKVAKENLHNFDKEEQKQRIEAIKRGRAREKDRLVVERAMREARERAFAEVREKAERAAVERASSEVRQRVMAEAQERFKKASTVKQPADKIATEAKLRSERAAVERATAEARERALDKAVSQKIITQGRVNDDKFPADNCRNSGLKHSFSSSDLEKYDGTSNESARRQKARLERNQRAMERAAKALSEKNMRDLLAQKEQAERNRLAESLDAEIKRWVTGKEGNLRALLSTLQYILGPNSGWQPITLTEIIMTPAVKKAYRKATLYVHPDKLQQRGASIQQKYICEKVFDLLKAAWNRFNSEER